MDERTIKKMHRRDRAARWFITIGGLAVIASVIAILFLIVEVTIPLFREAKVTDGPAGDLATPLAGGEARVFGVDDYQENAFVVRDDGVIRFFRPLDGTLLSEQQISHPAGMRDATVLSGAWDGTKHVTLLWSDGAKSVIGIRFPAQHAGADDAQSRGSALEILQLPSERPGVTAIKASSAVNGDTVTVVTLFADNHFSVARQSKKTDLFGNVKERVDTVELVPPSPERITDCAMESAGGRLYAATIKGILLRWDIRELDSWKFIESTIAFQDRGITALGLAFGSQSLLVGDDGGGVTTWMEVSETPQNNGGMKKLRRIHDLGSHPQPVVRFLPSVRDKTVLSLDAGGGLRVVSMTSNRLLAELDLGPDIAALSLAPRNDGVWSVNREGRFASWRLLLPHGEVSLRTLFGKVWYEGYNKPDYVWQSSAANDDYEPKYSITPLLFGTIKGTVYALVFAVPLAIFGAVYVSQFSSKRFRSSIKPAVEIMASVPSVILGFLAALWLAPLVETHVVAFFLFFLIFPAIFLLFVHLWPLIEGKGSNRFITKGYEFLIIMPVIVVAVVLSGWLGPIIEQALFGDFKLWLFDTLGARYDQRNCLVIAFGLGFCVIPIIFSIAEDSLSNIPHNLTAASLALGASPWQTVWRVVLPSASPGIFAGIMIGFGRAVGETMIVLMATGNTPIMDWSIFNGMRTLSANIAVEIPEAPFGGTLYRVLFLCSVLLFALTFVLNTGAELIREHLRKKYARY